MARKPNEKAMIDKIRAIQKASQANKRCADCPEMGPTYICVNFQTFVCQTCSGIHREFGHKMKGISMSTWTKQEVEDLENGGNERAADTWLARWSRQDCPEPDSSQPDKVRQYLKSKYVEKKWYRASGEDRDDDRKDRRSGDAREPERDRRDADRDREKADRDRRDAERDREKADRDRRDAERDREKGDRRDGGRDRDIDRRDDRDRKDRDREYDKDRRRDRDEDDGKRDRDRRDGDRRREREASDDERDRRDRRERRDADRDRDDRDRRDNDRECGRRRERELKEGSRGFFDESDDDRDRDRDRQNRDRREKEAAPPPSAPVDFFDPDKPSNAPAVPSGNPFGSSQGGGGDWADFASAKPQAQPPAPAPQPSGGLFDLDFSSGGGTSSGITAAPPTTSPTGNNMFDLTSGNSSSASANPLVAPAPAPADDKFAALQGSLGNLFNQPGNSPFAHLSPQNMGQPGVVGAAPGMPGAFPPGATPQPSGGAQQQMPAQMPGQMPQMMPGQMPQGGMPMMTPEQMANMNPQQMAQMQMMLQAQMQMMMQMQMQMQQPGAGGYPGQQPPGAPGSQSQAPLFNDLSAEFQQKASLGDPGTSGQMSANSSTAKPAGGSPFDMFG